MVIIKLNNDFFPDPEPPAINVLYRWSGNCSQFVLCSFIFSFVESSKLLTFSQYFTILLHFLLYCYTSFLYTKSSHVSYARVSIELIDCILLSSFELKAILLICSVKIGCLSKSLLCFYIDLLFFIN